MCVRCQERMQQGGGSRFPVAACDRGDSTTVHSPEEIHFAGDPNAVFLRKSHQRIMARNRRTDDEKIGSHKIFFAVLPQAKRHSRERSHLSDRFRQFIRSLEISHRDRRSARSEKPHSADPAAKRPQPQHCHIAAVEIGQDAIPGVTRAKSEPAESDDPLSRHKFEQPRERNIGLWQASNKQG